MTHTISKKRKTRNKKLIIIYITYTCTFKIIMHAEISIYMYVHDYMHIVNIEALR